MLPSCTASHLPHHQPRHPWPVAQHVPHARQALPVGCNLFLMGCLLTLLLRCRPGRAALPGMLRWRRPAAHSSWRLAAAVCDAPLRLGEPLQHLPCTLQPQRVVRATGRQHAAAGVVWSTPAAGAAGPAARRQQGLMGSGAARLQVRHAALRNAAHELAQRGKVHAAVAEHVALHQALKLGRAARGGEGSSGRCSGGQNTYT